MQLTQLSISKSPKLKAAVKMMVIWQNEKNAESHCLARVYVEGESAKVVFSDIRSNTIEDWHNPGISSEVGKAANQLFETVLRGMGISFEKVIWFKHYGEFMRFDAVGEDEFHYAPLDNDFKYMGRSTYNKLTDEQFNSVLGNLDIEDIYDVLGEIGWTRHIGGVRHIPASGKRRSLDEVMNESRAKARAAQNG
jgi:hypothetical protein